MWNPLSSTYATKQLLLETGLNFDSGVPLQTTTLRVQFHCLQKQLELTRVLGALQNEHCQMNTSELMPVMTTKPQNVSIWIAVGTDDGLTFILKATERLRHKKFTISRSENYSYTKKIYEEINDFYSLSNTSTVQWGYQKLKIDNHKIV